MTLPIRARLTLWHIALLASITAGLCAFLVLQLRADLRDAVDDEARAVSAALVHDLTTETHEPDAAAPADGATLATDFEDDARAALPAASAAQLLDSTGRVVARYGAVAGAAPLLTARQRQAALTRGATAYTVALGDEGQRYRVEATAFRDGGQQRVLVVALSLQRLDDTLGRLIRLLLVAGPVAFAASALAAYWLVRRSLRPIERMTSDAQEIGAGDLHERIAVPAARDELGRLATTLNAMLDRIEQGVTDRHRLVADASHELRTPLAVMRAEIDVSLRGDELSSDARDVLESARDEVDRMRRTVENLLTLAAVDEGRLELLTVRVDLRRAVEDAVRPLRALATAKEVALVVDGEHRDAQADPERLHLALTNLVENAIKFTPAGTTVRVRCWHHHGEVGVTVTDEGPGIPAEDREHLFDRYYRAGSTTQARTAGSGLGLAICREVALAHGGRVWVDSEPGGGSAFSLALPGWRALPSHGRSATGQAQSTYGDVTAPKA